jgi:cell division protease FtsH
VRDTSEPSTPSRGSAVPTTRRPRGEPEGGLEPQPQA